MTNASIVFEPREGGKWTKIIIEDDSSSLILKDGQDLATEWFASEIASKLLLAASPDRLVNFIIDRRARKPEGPRARATYRDPIYHKPNFRAILRFLDLQKEDYLLEVGCGGGAFLSDALKTGCKASAIDHSPDMVKVAREKNSDAIQSNRLEVLECEAESLPYPDGIFSAAVTTGVFSFFERPLIVLKEINRVLRDGGRLVSFTGSKELKGTPAAPEPMASRLHFYEEEKLIELALRAGFVDAKVEKPSLEQFAEEVGVPEEAMPLFRGPNRGGQFLLARKR